MTRAIVFLSAALAAASLGLFAQDNSRSPGPQPNAASAQGSAQNTASAPSSQQGTPANADTSSSPAPNESAQTAPAAQAAPARSDRDRGIEESGSVSRAVNGAPANEQLPQTSTMLPLLGLIGLGSLVAGLFARR